MADENIQILLEFIAKTQGAEAAASALSQLKTSTDRAGEGTEVLHGHTEKLHKLFHQLDHALPGLGLALRAAFSPEGIGIAATMVGFHLLKEAIESSNEAAKRAEENRKEAMAEEIGYWKDLFDSSEKYTRALSGGNVELDNMKNAAKELNEHIGRVVENMKFLAEMRGEGKGAIEVEAQKVRMIAAEQEWKRAKDAADTSALEADNEARERQERIETNTRLVTGLKRTGREPEALLLEGKVQADKQAIEDARTRHAEAQRYADEIERTLPGLAESFKSARDKFGLSGAPLGGDVARGAAAEHALMESHGNVNKLSTDQVESLKALNNLLQMVYGNNRQLWTQALQTLSAHQDDIEFLKQFAQRLNSQVRSNISGQQ